MLVMSASANRLRLAAIVLIMVLILTITILPSVDNAHYVRNGNAWDTVIYHVKNGNWEMWINTLSRTGMIVTSGNKLNGGSWDSIKAPFTIPEYARPSRTITNAAVTQNGGSTTAVISIKPNGEISLNNQGSAGSTNTLLASLTWLY